MILYSITMNIEKAVHDSWMTWIKTYHLPTIMQTGLITENKMLKILNEEEGNTGITYSFQYYLKNLGDLEKYKTNFEPAIESELFKKYSNQFVQFKTILEVVI